MASRIRKCADKKELEKLIDDFTTMGYEIKSQGEESAMLIKKAKKDKHLLVFLLTFWFTLGIGNLVYALIPEANEDEVLIRIEKD